MKHLFIFIMFAGILFSCSQSPSGDKAVVGDEKAVNLQADSSLTLIADTASSKIEWTGSKPTGQHNGYFKLQEGKINIKSGNIVGGTFVINIKSLTDLDLTDVKTNKQLVGHLLSADFLEADKYPTGKFEITSVEALATPAPGETHKITGNLTLKDVTKSITFNAECIISDVALTATSQQFVIDRTLWGANYGSKKIFDNLKDKFINDEVALKIILKANK